MVVVAHESSTGPNAVTIGLVNEESFDRRAARRVSMDAAPEVV